MFGAAMTHQPPATLSPSGLWATTSAGWGEFKLRGSGGQLGTGLHVHRGMSSLGLSRRQTGYWAEGGGSPVRPHLRAREGLKVGGLAASPIDQSGNLWCLFWACPWLPMDQLAYTFPALKPIIPLGSTRAEQTLG